MDPMGKQHESEPATESDKIMSKRHKAHRKQLDGMKDSEKKLKLSVAYNQSHMLEHKKAMVMSKEKMKSMKKSDKASVKMSR